MEADDLERQYEEALAVVLDGDAPTEAREAASKRLADLAPRIAEKRAQDGADADV